MERSSVLPPPAPGTRPEPALPWPPDNPAASADSVDSADSADSADGADSTDHALNTLLERMRENSDFPSLSRSVARIQRIAGSDTESLASLSSEILQDVALTQKLLRMVNTVHFKHLGAGGISTVSRAVALVGFAGIRNMALSLVLLEGLQDKQQADRLRDSLVRSLFAAQFAAEVSAQFASATTPGASDAEEAYLAALFHDLGRLLTGFYLPAEARAIDQLCQPEASSVPSAGSPTPAAPLVPEQAARRVLGVGFEALSLGVAKSWGLPEGLRSTLRRPLGRAPLRPVRAGSERHRWLAALANDLAQCMQMDDPAAAWRQVRQLAEQHTLALDCSTADILGALEQARVALVRMAPALGLVMRAGSSTQRLLQFRFSGDAPATALAAPSAPSAPVPASALEGSQAALQAAPAPALPPPEAVADMLTAGIQDVMSTLASDQLQINTVLRMVLETLLRALHLRRVVFCLRDPATQHITGRFGLGREAGRVVPLFRIATRAEPGVAVDLFSAVCIKGVDTVIADTSDPALQHRLPAWYGPELVAPSFLLLPLVMKGSTFGLIYADAPQAHALVLAEREMTLVRTLRNQAVMAFRQAG